MMWIEMVMHMSGTRANGEKYPPGWTPFEVADWEGEHLVKGGMARPVAPPATRAPAPPAPPAPAAPAPQPAAPELPVPKSEPSLTAAGPAAPAAEPEAPAAQEPDIPRPSPSDPKQSWIDYAIARGMDWDTASRMTKADLQSRFGGRL